MYVFGRIDEWGQTYLSTLQLPNKGNSFRAMTLEGVLSDEWSQGLNLLLLEPENEMLRVTQER